MSTSNLITRNQVQGSTRVHTEATGDVVVGTTRARQTARPASPFRDVLSGGVGLLVRGATVATSVVAGPVMAAAVREVGAGASGAIAGAPPGGRPVTIGGATTGTTGGDHGDLAAVHSMQRESQAFNLQLLGLQEDVQQENRRFTTVSNVLRAKHDTAKAAVANVRS